MHSTSSTATQEERQSLLRVNHALRRLIEQSIRLKAPAEILENLAETLEKTVEQFDQHTSTRALEYYNPGYGEDINRIQPYSPLSGHYNPVAPPLNYRTEGDKVIAEITFTEVYEGPPNKVHGGIISGIFDQILAIACTCQGMAGPTAYLNIGFKQPTPLNKPLRFEAKIDRIEGNKVFVTGRCFNNDILLSTAEALFIYMAMPLNKDDLSRGTAFSTL